MNRTLVKCVNPSCSQHEKIKSITPVYLGNGVQQRIAPVCTSCDFPGDMEIVNEREGKSD